MKRLMIVADHAFVVQAIRLALRPDGLELTAVTHDVVVEGHP